MIWVVIILIVICLALVLRLKAVQTQMSDLHRSDKLKAAFIRSMAREIRTPLHSVSGLADVISREDLYLSKGEKRNISEQIQYNARMISTLLDEVSIYSEDGSRGHQLEDERFSPNRLCQACIDANLPCMAKGVHLSFVHELGDEFFVSADRHMVELVLNKLVYCACRFTKQGEISVGCHCDDTRHQLTFYVQDTGGGIPEARKAYVFRWFENPDVMAEETEFDLSVAQRLASKIGGYLRYDETYTRGTRMEFVLPVR
jgi:signal transduction histidine kinase